jgi:hypothetical protein
LLVFTRGKNIRFRLSSTIEFFFCAISWVAQMNLYDFLDQTLNGATGGRTGFRELCQPEPMFVSEEFASLRVERIQYINEFFTSAIAVFRAALDGDLPPVVLEFLLNDAPRNLGFEYHRELESALLHRPRFLRTDEGMSGQVMEFQCPRVWMGRLGVVEARLH